MSGRAAIVRFGTVREKPDGMLSMKDWSFDASNVPEGVRPVTLDPGTGMASHVAGWPVDELRLLQRELTLLRCGLVRPEDFA